MKRCPHCHQTTLHTSSSTETLKVAGLTFSAELPAQSCTNCGEIYLDGPSLARFEQLVAAHLGSVGLNCGESFRFIRKTLGMRAIDVASLLDVTPETLSHWETDKHAIPLATWTLMGILAAEASEGRSTTLQRLQASQHPKKTPKVYRLMVPAA